MTDNNQNIYKLNTSGDFTNEIKNDLEQNMKKFNDPIILGELLYRMLEERENTNRILKNILAKLEALERKEMFQGVSVQSQPLLPEIDEEILAFVKQTGKVTAEDVKKHFNYKGKNAASARLNRMFEMHLLDKKQVGKKMFFFPALR